MIQNDGNEMKVVPGSVVKIHRRGTFPQLFFSQREDTVWSLLDKYTSTSNKAAHKYCQMNTLFIYFANNFKHGDTHKIPYLKLNVL